MRAETSVFCRRVVFLPLSENRRSAIGVRSSMQFVDAGIGHRCSIFLTLHVPSRVRKHCITCLLHQISWQISSLPREMGTPNDSLGTGSLEAPLSEDNGASCGAAQRLSAVGNACPPLTLEQARAEIRALWSRIHNLEADKQMLAAQVEQGLYQVQDEMRQLRRLVRGLAQTVQIHG